MVYTFVIYAACPSTFLNNEASVRLQTFKNLFLGINKLLNRIEMYTIRNKFSFVVKST